MIKKMSTPQFAITIGSIGIALITTGFAIIMCTISNDLVGVIEDKNNEIETYKQQIETINFDYNRLKMENDELWELYYSQVSDYEGEYEYYE